MPRLPSPAPLPDVKLEVRVKQALSAAVSEASYSAAEAVTK
jgi:hypothetical protein